MRLTTPKPKCESGLKGDILDALVSILYYPSVLNLITVGSCCVRASFAASPQMVSLELCSFTH